MHELWESIVEGFKMLFSKSRDKGYIHIITPRGEMGEMEFKANFGDKDSIERALNIINKEKELRFEKLRFEKKVELR